MNKAEHLLSRIDISQFHVLEFGPYNGRNTVPLARAAKSVLAIEPRPENIAATRAACAGLTNVEVRQGDVREPDFDGWKADLVFHSGVLYHLADPVAHLQSLPKLAPRLWLDTHVSEDIGLSKVKRENVTERKAGLEGHSIWLPLVVLMHHLHLVGFNAEIVSDRDERNGRRVTIWAEQGGGS